MPRLPLALEPFLPAADKTRRATTRLVGAATRRAPRRRANDRRPPAQGTASARDTARMEPESVIRHGASAPVTLSRPLPRGRPISHPFWHQLEQVQIPGRFVLEIADGRVVGAYAAHLTPGGVLDFETSDFWGAQTWREHPVCRRWRLPEPQHLPGTAVSLATRGTADNYYHFVMDLLPRWAVFRETFPDLAPDHVVVNRDDAYQQQYLDLLARDPGLGGADLVDLNDDLAVRADRLLVPSLPNHDTMAPPWTTAWLRRTFPASPNLDGPRRVYLTRGNRRNTRRLANESALLPILTAHDFEIVDVTTLSVQEQIDLLAGAEAVVGPHGAALTNLVFASPGVRVLELFAPRYLNWCFWAIASNIPRSRYRYLVGLSDRRRKPAGSMIGVHDDIVVDMTAFERSLEALLR